MSDLIITHEQAKVLSGATVPVAIRDPDGKLLGYVSPSEDKANLHGFTREEIARARQIADSDGPWYTTQQVLEHLRSLEQK
jgi:hypothetical protein